MPFNLSPAFLLIHAYPSLPLSDPSQYLYRSSSRLRPGCVSNYQFSSPTRLCLQLSILVSDPAGSPIINSRLRPGCVSNYQFSSPTRLCLQLSILVSSPVVSPIINSRLRPGCVSNYQFSTSPDLISYAPSLSRFSRLCSSYPPPTSSSILVSCLTPGSLPSSSLSAPWGSIFLVFFPFF